MLKSDVKITADIGAPVLSDKIGVNPQNKIKSPKKLNSSFIAKASFFALLAIGPCLFANQAYCQSADQAFGGRQNGTERRTISINAGENILSALLRTGVDRGDAQAAVRALARTIDTNDIKRNDQLTVITRQDGDTKHLLGFNLASGADRAVTVTRTVEGNYRARELATNMLRQTLRVAGVIGDNGLVDSIKAQGAPDRAAEDMGNAFAYDVDFQREIGPGSQFELMYDRVSDARGAVVREGEPVFARITTLSGRTIQLYRFQPPGAASAEWYNSSGQPARKFLMRTPINGARLTSNFGMRHHPISGYTRLHAGVDFGAPVGTPILAAGDGVVSRAGIMGGYGNVVDVEHGAGYSTRYGHLSRFSEGLRPGDRVRQGQVIAYSGNTGRSTGPHLHYEIRLAGAPINPMTANIPQGRPLSAEAIARFNAQVARVDTQRRNAMQGVNVAQSSGPTRIAN